jgi:predicted secreted protein
MSKGSDTKNVCGETGKRKRRACRRDNDEMQFEPDRKLRKRFQRAYVTSSSSFADCPPHRSAAGAQKVEIIDGRGY